MDSSITLKCSELGQLVFSSGLLHTSWSKISAHGNKVSGLEFKTYQEGIYTIVVFVAPSFPIDSAASTLLFGREDHNPFHFLCSKKISTFCLHTPAYQLFVSANKYKLTQLKAELIELIEFEKQVIITGAALGGSVASLFTLWLLGTIDPEFKRPLCITFGSPLLGDASLQQILEDSWRNSCFLHVADAAHTPVNTDFQPFGTFFICVGSQCICINDPETVMELLGGADTNVLGWRDYGEVLGRLAQPVVVDSRLMIDDGVIYRMVKRAMSKEPRNHPLIKLADMNISVIYLEFYKTRCNELKLGYYDWHKTHYWHPFPEHKINLNDFWISLVEEMEQMPKSEKSFFKTMSLSSANDYIRLVEPLDIAEYYLDDRRDYRTTGRSRHYVILEKWLKAEMGKQLICVRRDQSDLSKFDSCFWADVEEAKIATKTLKKQVGGKNVLLQKFAWFKEAMLGTNALKIQEVGRDVLLQKLAWFEEDVREMIRKGEVPLEILFERSSFMMWWGEYMKIKTHTFYTL